MSREPENEQFVGEWIEPVPGAFDHSGMERGEPALPLRFLWRDVEYRVTRLIEKWKSTGPCTHGSEERYVRKHYFLIETADGKTMTLTFDRRPQQKGRPFERWRIYTIRKEPSFLDTNPFSPQTSPFQTREDSK